MKPTINYYLNISTIVVIEGIGEGTEPPIDVTQHRSPHMLDAGCKPNLQRGSAYHSFGPLPTSMIDEVDSNNREGKIIETKVLSLLSSKLCSSPFVAQGIVVLISHAGRFKK